MSHSFFYISEIFLHVIFYISGEEYYSSNNLDSLLPPISVCPGVL